MKLRDVLRPEHVVVPLKARSVRHAAELLVDRLAQPGGPVTDPERLRAALRGARPDHMVLVGEHAFLPHLRTDAVRDLVAALGVSPAPIRWEKDPQRSSRIVVLVLAPPREAARYLQIVATFARTLTDRDTVEALLQARSGEEVRQAGALETLELPGEPTVRDVMTPEVVTAPVDLPVGDVARLMVERDIRAVPIVDEGGALVGMVSHRELLRVLLPQYVQRSTTGSYRALSRSTLERGVVDPSALPAREVMARTVLSVSEDQTLSDVATLMSNKDVDRCPVVRDGAVVGFLTRADLIRRLVTL